MSKISELERVTTLQGDSLFVIVNDPSGGAQTVAILASDIFGNVSVNASFSNLHLVEATPNTSSDIVGKGKVWFDSDFIYVATDDDEIKRVALSTF